MAVFLALAAGLVAGLLLGLIAGRLLARRDEQLLLSSFEGLASRALAGTRDEAGRELDGQRLAVDRLVTPLRHQLALVEAQLRGLEVERARAHAQLQEQVSGVRRTSELLGRETATLVDALRRPQARGRWGEVQLRRCVEFAGMVERCDFTDQASMIGVDGSVLRPDLVIRLAGGRSVVVLFLPGEAFLAPALEHDPALLEHAYTQRVHLATPTTLISLLRTVAHSWQQEALTENARAVVTAGKELYSRLGVLGAHVDKLGRSLGTAVTDFNKTVGSLERTLLPAARTLAELSLSEPPDAPTRISALPRPLSAPELVAPVTDVRQAAG